jgi:putative membrane protein
LGGALRLPSMAQIEKHVARQAEAVRQSAKSLEHSASEVVDSADRRTELAADRTVLAAERTYAAWVRTGLAALASGVGASALLSHILPAWFGAVTGSTLIIFSAFCFGAAVWRQAMRISPPRAPDAGRLPAQVLVALNGFLIVVALAALAGIWLARP